MSSNFTLWPETQQWFIFVYTQNYPFSIYYSSVFLNENDTIKLDDFGLSKALTQPSFASTYVGVCCCQGLISLYTHVFLKDSILYITWTHAREGIQLWIEILVPGLTYIWAVRSQASIPWNQNTFWTKQFYSVRLHLHLFYYFSLFICQIVTATSHCFLEDTPKHVHLLSNPCQWAAVSNLLQFAPDTTGHVNPPLNSMPSSHHSCHHQCHFMVSTIISVFRASLCCSM